MVSQRLGKVIAKSLQVDRRVQREVKGSQIKYLQKNWNDMAAGVLIVSSRGNGAYFIIDGQHRGLAMVQINPDYKFNALIFTGLSLRDEADLFNLYNDKRKGVKAHERYRIYLVSGAEPYVSIQRILDHHQLSITTAPADSGVAAVQKVISIYNRFGEDVLEGSFTIAEAAWGRQRDTWNGVLLGVIAIMLANGADIRELSSALRAKVPSAWLSMNLSTQGSGSEQRDLELARLILPIYNKGKKQESKLSNLTMKRTTA